MRPEIQITVPVFALFVVGVPLAVFAAVGVLDAVALLFRLEIRRKERLRSQLRVAVEALKLTERYLEGRRVGLGAEAFSYVPVLRAVRDALTPKAEDGSLKDGGA